MAEENNKYISSWKGAQIDKAYDIVRNIPGAQADCVVIVDANGRLKGDDSITVSSLALKTSNWEGKTDQILIQGEEGVVIPSGKYLTNFLPSISSGTNGNIPKIETDLQGNYYLTDSGISYSTLNSDHQTLQDISEYLGDISGGGSGGLAQRVSDLEEDMSEIKPQVNTLVSQVGSVSTPDTILYNINTITNNLSTINSEIASLNDLIGDTAIQGTITYQINSLNDRLGQQIENIYDLIDEVNDLYDQLDELEARVTLIEDQYVHVEGEEE